MKTTDFSSPATNFGDAIGTEVFETPPYVNGPSGSGPSGSLGDSAKMFPQGAAPRNAGLCGDGGIDTIVSRGFEPGQPQGPDPVLPAPNPGGDGLMVKLARLGKLLFGGN